MYPIVKILFNIFDVATRLNILSCHDVLKAICFSCFSILTITHNKVIFSSINKTFKTEKTINVNRSLSNFEKEISFDRIEWINVYEQSNGSPYWGYSIGTESTLTNGFSKFIMFCTDYEINRMEGIDYYHLWSTIKALRHSDGTVLDIICMKINSSSSWGAFNKLIATLFYDYMNKFYSGRTYKFTIEGTEFDYSNSIGHTNNNNARLYSPVSIHYNIVDDCTEVEAVRN